MQESTGRVREWDGGREYPRRTTLLSATWCCHKHALNTHIPCCSKHFTYINIYFSQQLFPFKIQGCLGTESLRSLRQVTQLVNGRARICSWPGGSTVPATATLYFDVTILRNRLLLSIENRSSERPRVHQFTWRHAQFKVTSVWLQSSDTCDHTCGVSCPLCLDRFNGRWLFIFYAEHLA